LRIGFAGAGGVGAYFGGLLNRGGLDITLLARGQHADLMKTQGLQITENGKSFRVRPNILDTARASDLQYLGKLDWLIFSCKAHQTVVLAQDIRPYLGAQTQIASLQNGVDNPALLEKLLQRPIVGGLSIRFAAHVIAPGSVAAIGNGYLLLGEAPTGLSERVQSLVKAGQGAGVDMRATDDIRKELWRKLIINNGVNPITALLRRDTGFVLSDKNTVPIVAAMMAEAAVAASGDGVMLTSQDIEELRAIVAGLDPFKPSMLVDVERGRLPELDAICGPVQERARRMGKPARTTETIAHLIRVRHPELF